MMRYARVFIYSKQMFEGATDYKLSL